MGKISPACKAAAKRKFKVWPSAYASGWGVRCTKAGGPSKFGITSLFNILPAVSSVLGLPGVTAKLNKLFTGLFLNDKSNKRFFTKDTF